MGDGEHHFLWRGKIHAISYGGGCGVYEVLRMPPQRGVFVKHTLAPPLDVCVPLSTISFCPQDDCEDIEGNDEKEEAEEEEGRSNGFQPSIRTPLAVITHGLFQGCVSVMLCLYGREGSVQFCGDAERPHTPLPWS